MKPNRLTAAIIAVCLGTLSQGQEWHALPGGNTITGLEYLGCDGNSTQPLRLMTVVNQPIDFSTNNVMRMRLNNSQSYTIGSFTSQGKKGALGICP
ncbi:MAG: hypothetical protein KJZ58_11980 [Flavobacteriales bacterium]|nr:hypothetical protein [Flavobacteriales bacterium]